MKLVSEPEKVRPTDRDRREENGVGGMPPTKHFFSVSSRLNLAHWPAL